MQEFITYLSSVSSEHYSRNAFCIAGNYYTYAELFKLIFPLSCKLPGKKNPNRRVGVITSNEIETYASILAIWLSGNTYVPIDMSLPDERIKQIVEQTTPNIVLSAGKPDRPVPGGPVIVNTKSLGPNVEDMKVLDFHPERPAYVMFTSGSTGTPKAVPVSYKNMDAFFDSFLSLNIDINENDSVLQVADLSFDMSIISTLIPLCFGACVYTLQNESVKYLEAYKILSEKNITVLVTPPSTLALLKPFYPEIYLEKLRYTLVGAEAFYETTAIEWQKCTPNSQIVNLYGPAEGGILASTHFWKPQKSLSRAGIVSIGKTVRRIKAFLVDDKGEVIKGSGEGELLISGAQVFKGYGIDVFDEVAFGKVMSGNRIIQCYKTGDIVFRDEDGFMFFTGRKDRQVKICGKRIELGEIEHRAACPNNRFFPVAICFEDMNGNNRIALFIDEEIEKDQIEKRLQKYLPEYMIPSIYFPLKSLPYTASGKTDLKQLEQYIIQKLKEK